MHSLLTTVSFIIYVHNNYVYDRKKNNYINAFLYCLAYYLQSKTSCTLKY